MTRSKHQVLSRKALKAMKQAVNRAVIEHKKSGTPLFILRNGKVTKVMPDKLTGRHLTNR